MILAINTSTAQFGLALLEENGIVVAEYLVSGGRGHFGNLMPALHFLLATSKSNLRDLKGLIIAIGPGSFTGLRVGLSTAKGLCHALDIPIVGIQSLKALASQIPYSGIPISPIIYSRKDEVFTARFVWSKNNELIQQIEDTCVKLDNLPSLFQELTIFIGNDFSREGPLIKNILHSKALLAAAHQWNLKASAVGALGLKRFNADDFDDLKSLHPLYHRPPDIRPNPFPLLSDSGSRF